MLQGQAVWGLVLLQACHKVLPIPLDEEAAK